MNLAGRSINTLHILGNAPTVIVDGNHSSAYEGEMNDGSCFYGIRGEALYISGRHTDITPTLQGEESRIHRQRRRLHLSVPRRGLERILLLDGVNCRLGISGLALAKLVVHRTMLTQVTEGISVPRQGLQKISVENCAIEEMGIHLDGGSIDLRDVWARRAEVTCHRPLEVTLHHTEGIKKVDMPPGPCIPQCRQQFLDNFKKHP